MANTTQLFSYSAFYYTPAGTKVYVNGIARGTQIGSDACESHYDLARISACVDICSNPRRKVKLGMTGITFTSFQSISDIEKTPYG